MSHRPLPDRPYAALRATLVATTPPPGDTPGLFEVVPTPDAGLEASPVAIPAERWARRGTDGVLADLVARIRHDPWTYTHVLGYLLADPGTGRAWAADRIGTVLHAPLGHGPGAHVHTTTDPTRLPAAARMLRGMALAVNGPATPAPVPATARGVRAVAQAAALQPAPCLFVAEPGPLAEALTGLAATAGACLQRRAPADLDVATWRTAQIVLLHATTPILDLAFRMPGRPGLVLLSDGQPPAGPDGGYHHDVTAQAGNLLGAEALALWPADHRWLHQRLAAATTAAADAAATRWPRP